MTNDQYVPGQFYCPKCDFLLCQSILHPNGISAYNSTPQNCPNDGTEMMALTWKQYALAANKSGEELLNRLMHSEKLKKELIAALQYIAYDRLPWGGKVIDECSQTCQEKVINAISNALKE